MNFPNGIPDSEPEALSPIALINQRRRKFMFRARLVVVCLAFGAAWHLVNRYEMIKLPPDACSPISNFEPGVSLLVDRSPEQIWLHDVVLYNLPDGGMSLGRVVSPPGSEPGTLRTEAGYWIRGDVTTCDVPDSRAHGTFDDAAVVARVLFPIQF